LLCNPYDRRRGMDLEPYSVAIGVGDGLVARVGHTIVFIADEAGASILLEVLSAPQVEQLSGSAVAKALGGIALGPHSALVPPFGLLAPTDGGMLLMLRGPVAAHIECDGAVRTVSGDRALTWVDETLDGQIDAVTVCRRDTTAAASTYTDLRSGVVPAGCFVLRHRTRAKSAPAQPDHEPVATSPAVAVQPPSAPPVATASADIPPEQRAAATVADERARYARQAAPEPALHQGSAEPPLGRAVSPRAEPTAEARADVGALTLDDTAVYPLDRPYVIGRKPTIDAAVRDSRASPIFLGDDPQISRVHAYVEIGPGTVQVRDAGTPAGTFVAAPGDTAWTKVGAAPTTLEPGWCLRIGQRILFYQKGNSAQ